MNSNVLKLSSGQLQRIGIARAILKDAPIFILDEATSHLDTITESRLRDSLAALMKTKTSIIITHRFSSLLLQMDQIFVFEKGKIVERGTHQKLIANKGLYKTLWEHSGVQTL